MIAPRLSSSGPLAFALGLVAVFLFSARASTGGGGSLGRRMADLLASQDAAAVAVSGGRSSTLEAHGNARRSMACDVDGAKHYTLGPGDSLHLGLLGLPGLTRLDVPVAPDGTISYLGAKRVQVLGKTVDAVRYEMEERLSTYHRHPRVQIGVAQLSSQRYTILGEVRRNGTFPLNRPTTLLEALAQAGGFQVGNLGGSTGEVADLKRSYVVREGRRLNVDLEGLFSRGDFSQNLLLQPGDYIYIASLLRNDIFVLGLVNRPGVYPIRPGMTATAALAAAGGLAKTAWRNRVLVLRGRMACPETHVVELNRMIHGRAADLELEPGDLVFVSVRPWSYPAQVLDSALAAYLDGSVAGWMSESSPGFSLGSTGLNR